MDFAFSFSLSLFLESNFESWQIRSMRKTPAPHHAIYLNLIFTYTILIGTIATHAQTPEDRWMLLEIVKDRPTEAEIYSIGLSSPSIFLPTDLPNKKIFTTKHIDNLVFNRTGLYLTIDGTNRVYIFSTADDPQGQFIRQDSSSALGYNYGAFVFSHDDTIFSLGGYGYWNYNWNLRYFSEASRAWELVPINKRIFVSRLYDNPWIDRKNNLLFYKSKDSVIEEGLRRRRGKKDEQSDKSFIYELNLRTKNWRNLGQMTAETMALYANSIRLTSTIFGDMLIQDSKANYLICFVDPVKNRVYYLKNRNLSTRIYNAIRNPHLAGQVDRTIAYSQDSKLTILLDNNTKAVFHLDSSELVTKPYHVYETPSSANFTWSAIPWWLVGGQSLIILIMLMITMRSRKAETNTASGNDPPILFDYNETCILQALSKKSDQTLSTEQIDEILGTANKSVDLKNKRRSLVIRSINQKFQERFETDEPLIRATRMESDRRMVQYKLVPDQYQIIQSSTLLKN